MGYNYHQVDWLSAYLKERWVKYAGEYANYVSQ
jgi:hypothetical protein